MKKRVVVPQKNSKSFCYSRTYSFQKIEKVKNKERLFMLFQDFFLNSFFWDQGVFYMKFDFKNRCKNEFQDSNKKSYS